MTMVCAVVVTHRRPDELAKSLDVLSTQSRLPDQLIVVDNASEDRVRDLVNGQPIPTTYLPSRRNLGGAGGFALGILHALAAGAHWVWLADDDGHPQDSEVLATLLACAEKHRLAEQIAAVARALFPLLAGQIDGLAHRFRRDHIHGPRLIVADVLRDGQLAQLARLGTQLIR